MLSSRLGMANPEDIRIHDNAAANDLCDQMGALAFTTGNHIFFAAGEYDPDSTEGQELIFHEAVHTIQQGAIDGSEGAAEEEAETNEAVAMQEDDAATGGDTTTENTQTDTGASDTNAEAETAESSGTDQAESVAESGMEQGADNIADAGETGKEAEPPSEAMGKIKGFVGKPPSPTQPESVSPPAVLSSNTDLTDAAPPEGAVDDSAMAVDDTMASFAGPDMFDLAVGEVMTFAGEPGADVLNLQAAEKTTYDSATGQVQSDNAAGEWILNNMVLANTTAKAMEIYNRWGALDDLPDYQKWNPLYWFCLSLDTVIMVLEMISGVLDVISLAILGLMAGLYIIAGISYALGTLLNFILAGMGSPFIAFAVNVTQFANWAFPPIFNVLDTYLLFLALIRIPLRLWSMFFWFLQGAITAAALAMMDREDDALAAFQDGASLAGNQVIGLAGDLMEVAFFNMTQAVPSHRVSMDELADVAKPVNAAATMKTVGSDALESSKKFMDPSMNPSYKIAGLRDATGGSTLDNFNFNGSFVEKYGNNSRVFNGINWGQDGVREIVTETGIDAFEAGAQGGIEFGQDHYKNATAANSGIYGQGKLEQGSGEDVQLAAAEASTLLQQKLIQQEAEGTDGDDDTDAAPDILYEDAIASLPPLEVGESAGEDSATYDLGGAMLAGTIARVGIIEMEQLAILKESEIEAMYYGQLVLADRAAFAETTEDLSTNSLEQNKEAENMLDGSAGDIQEIQGGAGEMADMGKTMNTMLGPLMAGAGAFMPVDSGATQGSSKAAVDAGSAGDEAAGEMSGNAADSGKLVDESKKDKENIIGDAQQSQKLVGKENEEMIANQTHFEAELDEIYAALDEFYALEDEAASQSDDAAGEYETEVEEASSWADETLAVMDGFWEEAQPEGEDEAEESDEGDDDTPTWEEMRELFINLSLSVGAEAQAVGSD